MSTVKSKKLQVGTDATASNNFTIYQPAVPDGTLRVGVGNADNPTEVGRFDSNGYVPNKAPAFRAATGLGSGQTLSANTWTKITLSSAIFDTDSCFDTSTYRFTPTVAGYYQVNASILWDTGGSVSIVSIYKNGASQSLTEWANFSWGAGTSINVNNIIYMNGTTDYIEMYGYHSAGTSTVNKDSGNTFLSAALIRAV